MTSNAKTPAAKTPAARKPAAKTPAAKTPAAKTPAAKPAAKASTAKPAGPTAAAKRTYASQVKAARSASQTADRAAWIIGDAAAKVASLAGYGDNALGQFADDIGQKAGTVRNFRTMAETFPADDIARDLQHVTVYGIFASQEDAHTLITEGDDGKPWSVSAARSFVQARKTPKVADRDALVSRIATLREQLSAAEDALAEYDASHAKPAAKASTAKASTAKTPAAKPAAKASTAKTPAAKVPAVTSPRTARHIVRGMPSHSPADCTPACSLYKVETARRTGRKVA